MGSVPFDTRKLASRLEGAGFPPKQAGDTAEALVEAMSGVELATGDDIASVCSEIATLGSQLGAEIATLRSERRAEIAAVRSEIAAVRAELKAEIVNFAPRSDDPSRQHAHLRRRRHPGRDPISAVPSLNTDTRSGRPRALATRDDRGGPAVLWSRFFNRYTGTTDAGIREVAA